MINENTKRSEDLMTRIGKLSGVKKELTAMKKIIEQNNIDIKILKKDNEVLRKLVEGLRERFIKRRKWQNMSMEMQKKKLEELKKNEKNKSNTIDAFKGSEETIKRDDGFI